MADLELRTNLSKEFTTPRTAASYPYILLKEYGAELPLLVQNLKQGELPIVIHHEGRMIKVGTCMASALELAKLLRVHTFNIYTSATENREVESVDDIMEVLSWIYCAS